MSFVVGFLLDAFGLDPANLVSEAVRMARHVVDTASQTCASSAEFCSPPMVVVPVRIILRLLDGGKRGERRLALMEAPEPGASGLLT